MFQKRSYEGYWWVPDNPSRKVPGILEFSQDGGIKLNLLTSVRDDPDGMGMTSEAQRFDKILGKTTDGDDITILNCLRTNATQSFGGTLTESYEGTTLLVGKRFSKPVEFSGIKVKSDLINAWAERSATKIDSSLFNKESDGPVKAEAGDVTTIKVEIPESIEAKMNGIEVKVKNDISTNINRRGGGEITDETFFEVKVEDSSIDLDQALNYSKSIEHFVSLALGNECRAEKLIGIGTDENTDIEILYVSQGSNKEVSIHPYKTNFILPDIIDDFGHVMAKWFNLTDEFSQPINLYFSTRYNDRMYVNNEFLSLTQAIEVYHRLSDQFDGIYIDPEEFEKYKSELEGTIKNEFDESFSSHLKNGTFKFANEYTLAKRMKDLVRHRGHILEDLPWDFESQVRPVVKARNELTHNGKAAVSTNQLYEYYLLLSALFETLLLTDIGIGDEQIQERLGKRYTELR